jgi:hypothetical protein
MIEQSRLAVDELIDRSGRATVETVSDLSAKQLPRLMCRSGRTSADRGILKVYRDSETQFPAKDASDETQRDDDNLQP